jgi:hypothetical protein
MMSLSVWVRKNLPGLVHPRMRSFILHHVSLLDKRTEWWRSKDPYLDDPPYSTYPSQYRVTLGIIPEFWHRHTPYIAACRQLGVAYRLTDISGPDWVQVIENSGCDAFLIWPSIEVSQWKQMYDERLRIITQNLKKTIYPTYDELWVYESKRRMYYWLEGNHISHAQTWVFYCRKDALDFARHAALPVVVKTNMGAGASGVRIVRARRDLLGYVTRCFTKGVVHNHGEARDPDWGFVLLQEYLPDAQEWRMRRIGDSYFGSQKLRKGDFHSGTGVDVWYDPPAKLLQFTREVTDRMGSRSMDLDIFETVEGRYMVNELQTVFGTNRPYEMLVKGTPGRYLYDENTCQWRFEEGIFCQNGCCNLRVIDLLEKLGCTVELATVDAKGMLREDDRQASLQDYAFQFSRRAT